MQCVINLARNSKSDDGEVLLLLENNDLYNITKKLSCNNIFKIHAILYITIL